MRARVVRFIYATYLTLYFLMVAIAVLFVFIPYDVVREKYFPRKSFGGRKIEDLEDNFDTKCDGR